MFSKYLALVLLAFQVVYAVPTSTSGMSQAGCAASYPGGFGITVTPISGKQPRA